MQKHVLWDLDGTLVESEDIPFRMQMFSYANEKIGLPLKLSEHDFIGREGGSIYAELLEKYNIQPRQHFLDLYPLWVEHVFDFSKDHAKNIKPRDNAIAMWRTLTDAGIKNSIVTNNREDVTKVYLANIGLDGYESLTCCNHASAPKPSPVPYQTAIEKLNVAAKDCVVIEDSATGIQAAKSAGLYVIGWVKEADKFQSSNADIITERLNVEMILNALKVAGA